jgi:hypothetical protein
MTDMEFKLNLLSILDDMVWDLYEEETPKTYQIQKKIDSLRIQISSYDD